MTEPPASPDQPLEDRESATSRRPFASRAGVPASELAVSIVDLARVVAASKGSSFASTHSLLVALLATGKGNPSDTNAAAWWWGWLQSAHAGLEARARELYPKGLDDPGPGPQAAEMTSDLGAVLDDAERMARDHGPKRLGARHLIGALLKPQADNPTNATKMLENAGVDLARCRMAFLESLRRWNQGDALEPWWRFLAGEPARPLSGYTSDLVAGDDLIGITREVEAMASLVAAWSVEPPLSIGLFGEWGSGKSFFMQKMKERVRQIAREARASEKGQREFGYYKNIVQVEFNAWHYVEGNLWASLVEHIFQNLTVDEEAADEEKQAEARQRKFFAQIGREEVVESEALARANSLEEERQRKEREAQDLTREQRDAEAAAADKREQARATAEAKRSATVRDVLGEVYGSAEIRAQLRGLLGPLGIREEQQATAAELRDAVDEALGAWTTLREGWRIVTAERGGFVLLAWVLAVPAALGLIGWAGAHLLPHAAGLIQWALTPISTLAGLAASVVAAWKRYKPRLQPLLATVDGLKAKRKELDARVAAAQQARDEEVAALELAAEQRRHEAADKTLEAQRKGVEAARAAEQAMEARRKIEALRKQIDELRPARRIASFIQERASAQDYRKHLGVPALIRRDFERLSRMFQTQRAAEAADLDGAGAAGRNDPAVVNRIVLYVDDLDRCPPGRVVEVLRAIHLLLAFPLFVVVVAVDARWVRRSLLDRFALMLSRPAAPTENASGETAARAAEPALPGEGATPDDYLEKIFQVAFWLRPLGARTSVTLVQNLTRLDARLETDAGDQRPAPEGEQGSSGGSGGQSAGGGQSSGGASGARPSGGASTEAPPFQWTPVTPEPRTLHVSASERRYMERLALLIGRSPRAVKRFLNSYRLIKAMLEPWELGEFVGSGKIDAVDGTYRPTMLLLAAVTGAPDVGQPLCRSLRRHTGNDPEQWLKGVAADGRLAEHREWETLRGELRDLVRYPPSGKTMGALVLAAERVERFAFTPSRLPERED